MCYSPTLIKNPNFGKTGGFSFMKDCVSRYIPIPCGHCGECVAVRTAGIVQRCELEREFGYPFFVTLTYNNESLPVHVCSDGVPIKYADYKDVQNMIKRLRKSNAFGRRFRYFGVSELGSLHSRPHFHILFFLEKLDGDSVYTPGNLEPLVSSSILVEWRRNYGSTRRPVYRPLCTFVSKWRNGKLNSTYDCHYVVPSTLNGLTSDVSFYITKYMLKDSDVKDKLKCGLRMNLDPDEFQDVWQKVKPRSFSSLNFGFGYYGDINPRKTTFVERQELLSALPSADIVRSGIARSVVTEDKPKFYDLESGKALPLSRYWYRFGKIYTMYDHLSFYFKSDERVDNVIFDERSASSKLLGEQKYLRNLKSSDNFNSDLLYD